MYVSPWFLLYGCQPTQYKTEEDADTLMATAALTSLSMVALREEDDSTPEPRFDLSS